MRIIARLSGLFVLACAVACGGDGDGGGDPTIPRLANASVSYSSDSDRQASCLADGFEDAVTFQTRFSGQVVGGTLHIAAELSPSGTDFSTDQPIPTTTTNIVTVVGGDTLEFHACVTAGSNTSLAITAWVVSAASVESNHVTATLQF